MVKSNPRLQIFSVSGLLRIIFKYISFTGFTKQYKFGACSSLFLSLKAQTILSLCFSLVILHQSLLPTQNRSSWGLRRWLWCLPSLGSGKPTNVSDQFITPALLMEIPHTQSMCTHESCSSLALHLQLCFCEEEETFQSFSKPEVGSQPTRIHRQLQHPAEHPAHCSLLPSARDELRGSRDQTLWAAKINQ